MTHPDVAADRPAIEAHSGKPALASLAFVVLLSSVGTSIANVAVPSLSDAFGATFQQVQWVVLAYLLAATCLAVAVGGLGDRLGRARLLGWGTWLFAAASLLCAGAPTLPVLIAGRALQGIGAAIMMALALAVARDSAGDGKVGRAMGVMAAMSAAGTALGPTVGGLLLEAGGWRAIFIALCAAAAAVAIVTRRDPTSDEPRRQAALAGLDSKGAVLLAAALLAYALAMTIGDRFGPATIGLLSGAAVAATLFVIVEKRAAAPLVSLAGLRDPGLSVALGANVIVSAVMMSTLIVGPFYLARVVGLGPAGIGAAMSIGPLVVALTSVPSGLVADRLGGRPSSLIGLAAVGAGSAMLAAAPPGLGLAGYLLPIVVVTLGYALFQTSNNLAIMTRAPRGASGAMSGMLNLSRNLGLVSGASLMGAVFASASGSADPVIAPAAAITAGMRANFALATVLASGALLAMLAGRAAARPRFP